MEDSNGEDNGLLMESKIEEEKVDEIVVDESINKEGEIRVCEEEESGKVYERKRVDKRGKNPNESQEKLVEEERENKTPKKRGKKSVVVGKSDEITLKDENLSGENEEKSENKIPKKRGKKSVDKGNENIIKGENLSDEITLKDGEIEENSENKIPKKRGKKSVDILKGENLSDEITEKEGEELSNKRPRRGSGVRKNYNDELINDYFEEDDENERKMRRRKGGRKKNVKEENGEEGQKEGDNVEEMNMTKNETNNKGKKNVEESSVGGDDQKEGDNVQETNTITNNKNEGGVSEGKRLGIRTPIFDENGIKIDSVMCHQCQRNDKGRVVRCTKCKTKRYCIPCIGNWSVFPLCACVFCHLNE